MKLAYTSELTLEQFELLQSLLPPAAPTGGPRTVDLMAVMQAILYVLTSGCAWGLLLHTYPPETVIAGIDWGFKLRLGTIALHLPTLLNSLLLLP